MAKQTYTIRDQSPYIDQIFVTTLDIRRKGGLIDQIFTDNPWLAFFYEKMNGNLVQSTPLGAGRQFFIPFEVEENPTAGAYPADTGIPTDDYDPMAGATYWPKSYGANVTWTKAQQAMNRGDAQIHSIIDFKIDNTVKTIRKKINAGIASGAGGASNEMDGLQRMIPATVATSQTTSIGGVSPSTYSWWRTQAINMTGQAARTFLEDQFITMFNNIELQGGKVDAILTHQTVSETIEKVAMTYLTTQSPKFAGVTFTESPHFKGKPVIIDLNAPTGEARFVDRDALAFANDPMYWLKWTDYKEIHNVAFTKFRQVICDCNLVRGSARKLGCIFNIAD